MSRPETNHIIISVEPEKAFDKIQYLLLIKILSKLEENVFNLIIGIYEKRTANIILNHERLNISPVQSGTKQVCFLTPTFSQHYPCQYNKVRKVNKNNNLERKK